MSDIFDFADQSDLPESVKDQVLVNNPNSMRYMNEAERLSAMRLRAKGLTYQAIADRLGYSRAAMHKLLTKGTTHD